MFVYLLGIVFINSFNEAWGAFLAHRFFSKNIYMGSNKAVKNPKDYVSILYDK